MKTILRSFSPALKLFGFNPGVLFYAMQGVPFYINDVKKIKKQKSNDSGFYFGKKYPVPGERFPESDNINKRSFQQDLLIAKKIYYSKPKCHVDIGSRRDGLISQLTAFRKVEILDIWEQTEKIENVIFRKIDLMRLPEDMIEYCDSISSLHSLGQFGFRGYGNEMNCNDHSNAIQNIYSLLKRWGKFYFSAAIGTLRTEFNTRGIFSLYYLLNLLKDKFYINNFSYVNDSGDLYENVELSENNIATNLNCDFGCGIFELTKL